MSTIQTGLQERSGTKDVPLADHDRQKIPHSLTGCSSGLILKLFLRHGLRRSGIRQWGRWFGLSLPSPIGVPLRWQELLSARRREALHTAPTPPLFVIGHWRSGTTHLHNLLTQDPQFGYLTMGHCITADAFLTMPQWINRILARQMPESRPVDGVAMGWEVPQEEEFALERITDLSYNHCYLFPDRAEEIFRRCVTFDAGPQYGLTWMCEYDHLIRRLSFDRGGKTLCLKNPPNTARIEQLLGLYPEARFVYIVRHPEQVFRSTRKLWQTVTRMLGLTSAPPEQLEANFVLFYELLLKQYLAQRAAIPEGRLVEVKFEDVDEQPLATIERIYSELNLEGFETAKPHLIEYAESLKHFQKNPHRLDEEDLQTVRDRWGFAYDEWGYE